MIIRSRVSSSVRLLHTLVVLPSSVFFLFSFLSFTSLVSSFFWTLSLSSSCGPVSYHWTCYSYYVQYVLIFMVDCFILQLLSNKLFNTCTVRHTSPSHCSCLLNLTLILLHVVICVIGLRFVCWSVQHFSPDWNISQTDSFVDPLTFLWCHRKVYISLF